MLVSLFLDDRIDQSVVRILIVDVNTANHSASVLVQERIDVDFQRRDDWWIFGLFDDFDQDPGIGEEWRTAVIEDDDLQVVMIAYFVVEASGSAQRTVSVDAEGVVHVSRPDLKGEGPGVGRSIGIRHLQLEDNKTERLVFLGDGCVIALREGRWVVVGIGDFHSD